MWILGSLLLALATAGPVTTTTPHGNSTTTRPAPATTRQASTTTRPGPLVESGATTTTSPIKGGPLLRVVHWDFPVGDICDLKPGNATQLYYSSERVTDPDVEHLFAAIDATLTDETVMLGHSKDVKEVSCGADGTLISFVDSNAFAYAAREKHRLEQFHQLNTAHIKNEIETEDAIPGVHLFWENYELSSQATSGGISRTTGVTSVANGGSTITASGFTTTTKTTTYDVSTTTTIAVVKSNCGAAPSPTIDGLPAAACGNELFDRLLNDALEYVDFSNGVDQATWNAIPPSLAYPGSRSCRSL